MERGREVISNATNAMIEQTILDEAKELIYQARLAEVIEGVSVCPLPCSIDKFFRFIQNSHGILAARSA